MKEIRMTTEQLQKELKDMVSESLEEDDLAIHDAWVDHLVERISSFESSLSAEKARAEGLQAENKSLRMSMREAICHCETCRDESGTRRCARCQSFAALLESHEPH